jgi:hypothetical protein
MEENVRPYRPAIGVGVSSSVGVSSGGSSTGLGQPRTHAPAERPVLLTVEEYQRQQEAWSSFEDEAWQPFVEAWRERFPDPPPGSAADDPDTTLRSRLWIIADARPNDLGRWVREAKGRRVTEVLAHVFAEWSRLREDVDDYEPPSTPEERRRAMHSLKEIVTLTTDREARG